jgi:epoxyqueuosine reductase
MDWMAETRERRGDPQDAVERRAIVVVFALNYGPDEDPRGILDKPTRPRSPSMPATATITTSSRDG